MAAEVAPVIAALVDSGGGVATVAALADPGSMVAALADAGSRVGALADPGSTVAALAAGGSIVAALAAGGSIVGSLADAGKIVSALSGAPIGAWKICVRAPQAGQNCAPAGMALPHFSQGAVSDMLENRLALWRIRPRYFTRTS